MGENDNKAAASKFSHELGTTMPESSMRTIKKSVQKLQEEPDPDKITSLPHGSRGRPLMLGCYDHEVTEYIISLCAVHVHLHNMYITAYCFFLLF